MLSEAEGFIPYKMWSVLRKAVGYCYLKLGYGYAKLVYTSYQNSYSSRKNMRKWLIYQALYEAELSTKTSSMRRLRQDGI